MSHFLYHYHPVEPATWFYLSSLLTIGLFFKFSRFWSVRNLDLLLLIALGPGLLFLHYGKKMEQTGLKPSTPSAIAPNDAALNAATLSAAAPLDAANGVAAPGVATTGSPSPSTAAGTEPAVAAPNADQTVIASNDAASVDVSATSRDATGFDATGPASRSTGTSDAASNAPAEPEVVAADGTLVISTARRVQFYGYLWLFCGGGLVLARLLADPTMVRRPLLEPNLSAGGLTFIGCSLFVFLMANVISKPAAEPAPRTEPAMAQDEGAVQDPVAAATTNIGGPEYAILTRLPVAVKKGIAILAHLTIVMGMVLVGYRHFDNIVMGVGAATLYLMLPYTALMTNEFKHALPAAALVWAVLCYRKPLVSGALLGFAGGVAYYPLFLLPLWLSFYWARGLLRFVIGLSGMLVLLLLVLSGAPNFLLNVQLMFGLLPPAMNGLLGVWDQQLGGWNGYYRMPVLAAFLVLVASMTLWPAQKNLGTLLSCSAAIMVATQFWHGYGGGTYMAWYLPLMLLTVFRPNLEDRVALTVLAEGWLPRRISILHSGKAA